MSKKLDKALEKAAVLIAEEFIQACPDSDELYEEWEEYGYEDLDDASETMQAVIEKILKNHK